MTRTILARMPLRLGLARDRLDVYAAKFGGINFT